MRLSVELNAKIVGVVSYQLKLGWLMGRGCAKCLKRLKAGSHSNYVWNVLNWFCVKRKYLHSKGMNSFKNVSDVEHVSIMKSLFCTLPLTVIFIGSLGPFPNWLMTFLFYYWQLLDIVTGSRQHGYEPSGSIKDE
jgi:hypothetical protein